VKSGRTRYESKLCRTIFYQVLSGINFMHTLGGVAHLDIKLENLVVDSSYIVKVIDFAFSEPID
jgi:serine/threonine protein kinase